MDIKDYVKNYNLTYEEIKKDFKKDFDLLFIKEKEWLGNIEDKLHLIKQEKSEIAIKRVIKKLKSNVTFENNDTDDLSTFISKINTIVQIANRINNFKEGTLLTNGKKLILADFFNEISVSKSLASFNYELNTNLNSFLPHIFSVVKHFQEPTNYPVYYKYWKNILREVLSKQDDYDSMCDFYRQFPLEQRHLNFAVYLGTIGIEIAKNIQDLKNPLLKGSKDYKYLTNDVINVERYNSILNETIGIYNSEDKKKTQYWLYSPGENANKWEQFYNEGIMALGWDEIGNLEQYKSRNEIKQALVNAYGGEGSKKNDVTANDEFINKINLGDIIIVKKGRGELLGYGTVASEYYYDESRTDFKHIRKVEWKVKGNWTVDFSLVLKTLTDITSYYSDKQKTMTYYDELLSIIGEKSIIPTSITSTKAITFPLNTILYGPPGTGKTHSTILRAAQIIENRTIESYKEALDIFKANLHDRIEFITFHQNYSYEDFIQGLRPDTKDETEQLRFKKIDGVFKKIADRALKNKKESEKAPEELSKEKNFDKALSLFIDDLNDNDGVFKITDNCQVYEAEEDAFRYTGDNWTRHSNGIRMKFSDLKEFYLNDIQTRKEIKSLDNISGLAKQHSTYYLGVYNEIKKYLSKTKVHIKAAATSQNYVIIIDEINRANISRVFGELITLIEPDKRSHGDIPLEARLPSGDPFIVPSNLYIIGTMNTADKSIALLDIALRRRFEFESMYPKYEIEGQQINHVEILQKINEKIIDSKGHDFQIGHSYFMGENKNLIDIMNKKVIPLLLEYYMNDDKEVKGILQAAGLTTIDKSWPIKISGTID